MSVLSSLEPQLVFTYFEAISKIPRGSGNMEQISAYVKTECEKSGACVMTDGMQNVIAVKKASSGYENAPAIMLQGHMDMVAEKTSDSSHDFSKDPLTLILNGDRLSADKTTLGADDGIAVAIMLAILNDSSLKHPRIECVFTTDEETGMFGASAIDLSFSQAKYLLNLDNEEEGVFTVSCAGGARFEGRIPLSREQCHGNLYQITVESEKGGHSGTEISKDRPNTNVVAGELISDLLKSYGDIRILSVDGGLMDNAIPMRTEIVFLSDIEPAIKPFEKIFQAEFASTDDTIHLNLNLLQSDTDAAVISSESLMRLLLALTISPNGAMSYNHLIPGLVETSLNQGILKTEEDVFIFRASVRSSVESKKERLLERLTHIFSVAGGNSIIDGSYPGWAFRKDSPFRTLSVELWNRLYPDKPAKIEAIHAGLECGLLLQKKPDLDILSIGPDAKYIHTPREEVSVSSVGRVYRYVTQLLESVK